MKRRKTTIVRVICENCEVSNKIELPTLNDNPVVELVTGPLREEEKSSGGLSFKIETICSNCGAEIKKIY